MNTRIYPLICVVTIVCLLSCDKDDPQPVQLLTNTDVETGTDVPTGWRYITTSSDLAADWSSDASSSPSKSLKITTAEKDDSNFSFWTQVLTSDLPVGKDVTLKVKVKSEMVGVGAAIAIRVDTNIQNTGPADQFYTSQGNQAITGTFDWTEFTVKLEQVNANAQVLYVYLLYLNGTTGDVYFDDITLTVN